MIRQYRYSIGRPGDGCINSTFMRPAIYDTSTGCEDPMETLNIRISVRKLPSVYTCDGEDKSPEIDVGGVNVEHSKCLAIICNDPDATGWRRFYSLDCMEYRTGRNSFPKKFQKIPTVTFPIRAVQGTNSLGQSGIPAPAHPTGKHTGTFSRYTGWTLSSTLHPVPLKRSFYEAWAGMLSSIGETYVTYGR